MINSLRGEFQATLGGEPVAFDTTLGTIASIEDRCGDLPIVDIINRRFSAAGRATAWRFWPPPSLRRGSRSARRMRWLQVPAWERSRPSFWL